MLVMDLFELTLEEQLNALKVIFPASKWEEGGLQIPVSTKEENVQEIEKEVEIELGNFLQNVKSGVFVLESMDIQSRDNWMKYLVAEATNFGIPQIELWGHSARICKKITDRTNTEVNSIYKAIYGGNNQTNNEEEDEKEENAESNVEFTTDVTGDFIYTGKAFIDNFDLGAETGTSVKVSISFKGNGNLTKATVV